MVSTLRFSFARNENARPGPAHFAEIPGYVENLASRSLVQS
jgi:hypothetical protein